MADDELTENSEGPRRKTFTPPADDAVFTGSFPAVDESAGDDVPFVPPTPAPSAAIAPPVRTSLSDAAILAKFSGEGAGNTAELMDELERQVTLREDEEEAFTMWANLTRATRGSKAEEIINRERIVFDGGIPEPLLAEPEGDDDLESLEVELDVAHPEPIPVPEDDDVPDDSVELVAQGEVADEAGVVESEPELDEVSAADRWPLEQMESSPEPEPVAEPSEDTVAEAPPREPKVFAPLVDRIGLEPTPDNHKTLTRVGLFWLWWATLTPVVGIVAGAFLISRGLGVLETLAALGVASVISGGIIAASAFAGARTGLSSAHTSQVTFGRAGAIAPSALLVVIRIALLGVLVLAAQSLITRIVLVANWWPYDVWIVQVASAVLVAAIVVILGVLGGRVLRLALYASAGLSTLAIAGFVVVSAPTLGLESIDPWSAPLATVVALGSLSLVSFLVLFGHTGGDLSRYSSGSAARSASALSGIVAVVPTVVFVVYVGWVASATPVLAITLVTDPVGSLAGQLGAWFPAPLLSGLVLPLIVLSALSLFSGGLAVLSAGLPVSRQVGTLLVAVLALGGAGAAIALEHRVSQYFPDALYFVGVVLVAWGASYATDIALGHRRLAQLSTGEVPAVRFGPLAGFVVAVALGWGLISSSVGWLSWVGYIFPLLDMAGLVDLSGAQPGVLVALVVAGLVSAAAALSRRSASAEVVDG
jgi:nucleobase:cation symporter-1, NCS1 family